MKSKPKRKSKLTIAEAMKQYELQPSWGDRIISRTNGKWLVWFNDSRGKTIYEGKSESKAGVKKLTFVERATGSYSLSFKIYIRDGRER